MNFRSREILSLQLHDVLAHGEFALANLWCRPPVSADGAAQRLALAVGDRRRRSCVRDCTAVAAQLHATSCRITRGHVAGSMAGGQCHVTLSAEGALTARCWLDRQNNNTAKPEWTVLGPRSQLSPQDAAALLLRLPALLVRDNGRYRQTPRHGAPR